jgi:hypothetical protein
MFFENLTYDFHSNKDTQLFETLNLLIDVLNLKKIIMELKYFS